MMRPVLLLCFFKEATSFGGLASLKTNVNAEVEVPPGEFEPTYGWDQTKEGNPLKATTVIGNTRVNIWKWDLPPPPAPPPPPEGCCDVYPLGFCEDCNSLTCINCCESVVVAAAPAPPPFLPP